MNGATLSSSPPDATANEYETGVSNGDVDWLFRGKSKKLTKKMNTSDPRPDKESRTAASQSSSAPSPPGKSLDGPGATTNDSGGANGATSHPNVSAKGPPKTPELAPSKAVPIPVAKPATQSPAAAKQSPSSQMTPPERTSKLDKFKFGRSRSSSASASGATRPSAESINPMRRSSTNNIPPIGQIPEGEVVRSNSIASQGSSSPGVSRSNSTSKKSLFSSLSSKFKGSSSPQQSSLSASLGLQKVTGNFMGNPEDVYEPSITPPNRSRAGSLKETPPRSRSGSKDSTSSGRPRVPSRDSTGSDHDSITSKFFKRKSSGSANRVILNKNKGRRPCPIPELNTANIRRVTFAVDKLEYDPQQQIPSRRPRKGNVLIPEDLIAPPPRLSLGISLSDGGKVNQEPKYTERELTMAMEAQQRALLEAEKHAHEAHVSAKRIAAEVQAKSKKSKADKEEKEDDLEVEVERRFNQQNPDSVDIDSPLHVHENHFEETTSPEEVSTKEISLETVYTRCCHLREILPIPATLKQLKNKSKPLQVLKLLNPKPTLIDVLSFSDFIAITPINTVIFDNVSMSTEMLKHLLASLQSNTSLEKLSLRNVAIDEVGWVYLCKLLIKNLNIKKLDISQQRIKSDTKSNSVRSAMNWNLFINSLIYRGGIEELVINGCKLSDETFEDLLDNAVMINTYRLGVASIELNMFKAIKVANWIINPSSKCVGVDIAFNDLSQGQLAPFIKAFRNSKESKLIFFSLNSTNLTDVDQTSELIEALSNVKTLRFLDLSSLPKLFPSIISKLSEHLPNFPNIKRIHFDLNELSTQAIRAIAEILPKIPGVMHVSLLGNRNLDDNSAGSLYTSIKLSRSIFTLDLDYDLVPDDLSQRIAFYLMRNMDKTMNEVNGNASWVNNVHHAATGDDELMFDGSLLMETAEKLLIESDEHNKKEEIKIQKFITDALIERTRAVRIDIHRTIDELFEKRNSGTLSLEGKETLLRFCLLDSSLEKLVHMFEERARRESSDSVNSEKSGSGHHKKNIPSLTLPPHDQLHESSNELITSGPILSPHNTEKFTPGYFAGIEQTFQPHQVVIDSSSDGLNVPIDNSTGRPVLMRSISHTSVHAKEQEQEEGEFHRLGFYIEQRNNSQNQLSTDAQTPLQDKTQNLPMLNSLPSGSELRDAIIAAKGIESVTELISKISNNRVSLDKLYQPLKERPPCDDNDRDNSSIDSFADAKEVRAENDEVTAVVDEVYDKLLNDAQRVRSNKSG